MAVRRAPHSLRYLADLSQCAPRTIHARRTVWGDGHRGALKLKRSAVAIAPDGVPSGYGLECGLVVRISSVNRIPLCPPSETHWRSRAMPRAHGHGRINFDSSELISGLIRNDGPPHHDLRSGRFLRDFMVMRITAMTLHIDSVIRVLKYSQDPDPIRCIEFK